MEYRKDTILGFGKHKGMSVEEILVKNPSYIRWAIHNIDSFEMSDSDTKMVFKLAAREDRDYYEDDLGIGCFESIDYC